MSALIEFFSKIFIIRVLFNRLRGPKKDTALPDGQSLGRAADVPAFTSSSGPRPPESSSEAGTVPIPTQRSDGPGPDSPLDLHPVDWKATIKRTIKEIKDDRITLAAAGMAYYLFLAIFPALIAAVGILGLVHTDATGLVTAIQRNFPGGSGKVLVDAFQHADRPSHGASLFAAVTGIVLALWSASSGMVALQSGLNICYDVPEDRKLLGKRAVALLLIGLTGILGGVPSPFFTFGESPIYKVIGALLTLAAVVILFALYYYIGPKRHPRPSWKWVSAGGVVGATIWIVASLGFGYYASNFSSYGKTYGPLAGVIILIFWLFLSSIAVLVGGELNAELERQAASETS